MSLFNKVMSGVRTGTAALNAVSRTKNVKRAQAAYAKVKPFFGKNKQAKRTRRKVFRAVGSAATVAGLAVAGKRLGVKGGALAGLAGYGAHKLASAYSPKYAKRTAAMQRLARATSKGVSFNQHGPLNAVAKAAKSATGQKVIGGVKSAAKQWKGMSTGQKIATGLAAYSAAKIGKRIVTRTVNHYRDQRKANARQTLASAAATLRRKSGSKSSGPRILNRKRIRRY